MGSPDIYGDQSDVEPPLQSTTVDSEPSPLSEKDMGLNPMVTGKNVMFSLVGMVFNRIST